MNDTNPNDDCRNEAHKAGYLAGLAKAKDVVEQRLKKESEYSDDYCVFAVGLCKSLMVNIQQEIDEL